MKSSALWSAFWSEMEHVVSSSRTELGQFALSSLSPILQADSMRRNFAMAARWSLGRRDHTVKDETDGD